ncbi:MAG: oligosaccharide flippase family protein, partial [Rubrobacteraceae bacterium]
MKDSPEQEQYGAYVGRIARGAGIGSFGQGVGRALNFLTQIALARMYGPALLGFYVLGTTVIQMCSGLAQFGMGNGMVRYVAHYRAQGDAARVRGTILIVLWTAFALSTFFAILLFFGADFLADTVFNKPASDSVFRAFSICLPFFTVMNMVLVATQAFQTMKYTSYVKEIQRPLLNLVLVVVFYLLGAQIVGAVIAYALSFAAGVVISFLYLRRIFPRLFDRGTPPKFEPRAVFSASAPMVIANFGTSMSSWIVVTILGIMAAAESVGIFNAAVRTAALSALVLAAFSNIFSPMVSGLYANGRMEELGSLYRDVSRWVFTGSLGIFLLTVLLARDIMAVFGPEFVDGWVVMVVVASGQ